MGEKPTADEKQLEKDLCQHIHSGQNLDKILIVNSKGETNLLELLGKHRPSLPETILEDTSAWNQNRTLSVEMFGGIVPDIVLRSSPSGQNRVMIEVKKTSSFTHKERHSSQVLRYFMHLVATTDRCPELHCSARECKHDIRRAVVLAAPNTWFDSKCAEPWHYFLEDYGPVASQFDITLGKIVLK